MTNDGEGFEAIVELGVTLPVSDMDRALDFYCENLGFALLHEEEDPGHDRRTAIISYGNILIDLVLGDGRPKTANYRLFWFVDDMDAALDHLQAAGGSLVRRMEYGVFCRDPDGNTILVKEKGLDSDEAQEFYF
jgi:catechol 2,3-dioxygenase-like lactoylglutathione lyase family enzyme